MKRLTDRQASANGDWLKKLLSGFVRFTRIVSVNIHAEHDEIDTWSRETASLLGFVTQEGGENITSLRPSHSG
jgi:hypothetical protein